MNRISEGFALTGSYCTISAVLPQIKALCELGYNVIPIVSQNVKQTDTRFGKSEDFMKTAEDLSRNKVIDSIKGAEPIGPGKMLDALIIAPCTGNTLGKLANGITDTPVTMAAKSTIRNEKPVIIAVSTNDGLGNSAKNIGALLNFRNIFFVPFGQDDHEKKPRSLVADMNMIPETLKSALEQRQIQPLLVPCSEK